MLRNVRLGSILAAGAVGRRNYMRVLVASLVTVLTAAAANAESVIWAFQGNEYSGTGDDLAGEVTVALDDEDTPGSVKIQG